MREQHILSFVEDSREDKLELLDLESEENDLTGTLNWIIRENGFFLCTEDDDFLSECPGFPHFHAFVRELADDSVRLTIQYLGRKAEEILFVNDTEAYEYVEDLIWEKYQEKMR